MWMVLPHTEIPTFSWWYEIAREVWQWLWQTPENQNSLLSLNETQTIFYSPSEHLVVDEGIVLFKGRVIF
jgi:hypothetical protein